MTKPSSTQLPRPRTVVNDTRAGTPPASWLRVAVAATATCLAFVPSAHAQRLETVLRWNLLMQEAVVTPGANPPTVFVHRPMAIVSVAMFDAANSFERQYHDLLPNMPGYWQPTPPANAAATFTHYPDVQGFVIASGRRFLMEAPPALRSERYAADFNETKTLGGVNSTARTPEQTQMARLWHGVGTTTTSPNLWNTVLADLARAAGWSGLQAARGFALLNMTQHDALLTAFTGKFLYGFWRPVTAIREAARDGNEATEPDAGWTPLLPTPPYPGHPGNRACLSASQARLLERVFGRADLPVQVTWNVPNGTPVTRAYASVRQLADEEANSRIWGGIHFQFESLASRGVCSELADYAADNVLRFR